MTQEEQAAEALSGLIKTATKKSAPPPKMRIKVYSPYQTYFDDFGYSISAVNASGEFDILPRHHNFITLLSPCYVSIQGLDGVHKIRISGGLMHVKSDKVIVFLDI